MLCWFRSTIYIIVKQAVGGRTGTGTGTGTAAGTGPVPVPVPLPVHRYRHRDRYRCRYRHRYRSVPVVQYVWRLHVAFQDFWNKRIRPTALRSFRTYVA